MQATPEVIAAYCAGLTEYTNAEYLRRGDKVNSVRFAPSPGGKKYVRVVQFSIVQGREMPGGSAHCFVKVDDGSLWKPAGWKGPAKNFSRGNVSEIPKVRSKPPLYHIDNRCRRDPIPDAKLDLSLVVTFHTRGTPIEQLKQQLVRVLDQAMINGDFCGDPINGARIDRLTLEEVA